MTMIKDPSAILDYKQDWSKWMVDADAIISHSIVATSGINVDSSSNDDSSVTFWLSGGTAGSGYNITVQISTSAGRVDERTMRLIVMDR